MAEYGQLNQAPVTPEGAFTCEYFMTQLHDATYDKDSVPTLALNHNRHLRFIFARLWQGSLVNMQVADPGVAKTTLATNRHSLIAISGAVQYILRNQSTEAEFLTAYWCKVRKPFTYSVSTTITNQNHYQILSRGFAQNGITPGTTSAITNEGMTEATYTPFQSVMWTQSFKIQKTKRFILPPGQQKQIWLKSKTKLIKPDDIVVYDDSDNLETQWTQMPFKYEHNAYERFILFRIDARPAGRGLDQVNYTKAMSHTSPTVALLSRFTYTARIHHTWPKPYIIQERSGIQGAQSTANTIINEETAALSEEKDAE